MDESIVSVQCVSQESQSAEAEPPEIVEEIKKNESNNISISIMVILQPMCKEQKLCTRKYILCNYERTYM